MRRSYSTSRTEDLTHVSGEDRHPRCSLCAVDPVYDITPVVRSPAQVMARSDSDADQPSPAPTASGKWLTASVVDDAAEVVTAILDGADPAAEAWVADKTTAVLDGRARQVAAGIRRRATHHSLDPPRRINAYRAAAYLTSKADYLDDPSALALRPVG